MDEAIGRIVSEVGWTYPAFELRRLDWEAICARHIPRVKTAGNPLAALQEWIAELQDGHTWVREQLLMPLTYSLWVTPGRAVFERVQPGTAAWEVGVRVGDELTGEDTEGWWARANAPVHARPLVAGRRLLSGPPGIERAFVARTPSGKEIRWSETPTPVLPFPLVSWSRLPAGTGYLRVEAWRADSGIDEAIDAAFEELEDSGRLIVDLRGNTGGNLLLAHSFRDRFLREPMVMGSLRISTGDGGLSEPEPILGEPSETHRRWEGDVRFLTDPLTFSASEDALLGLQGLDHVKVVGEPSGGGSGRQRVMPLLPGQILMVSTALTYDRRGHCVEGAGIPVDVPVVPDRFAADAEDLELKAADGSW
jgi:carboxyl-terminal processing protease